MEITDYSVELIKDPYGILSGKRYEFTLDVEVAEDDELYTAAGLYVRVIFLVDGERTSLVKCDIYERNTDKYIDYGVEEEEEAMIEAFCVEHYKEAE
ncbi:DUF6509 family protein [Paenibacillus sp. GCM10023252]|uniref:DUF6509 family protein n=1 Tax=Paenibacillus sp. GCM10023252 TaxID=3252649 RepID=UPI003612EA58